MTNKEAADILRIMPREEVIKEIEFQMQCAEDEGRYSLVKVYKYVLEVLSEPTKIDILSDIADLKKSPWFTFGENSLNPISREQYLARKEAAEVIEDLCIKKIDSEPTKTEPTPTGKITCNSCSYEIELSEPIKTEPKWVSVSERLPENFQRVLVTIVNYNGNKVVRVAEYYGKNRIFQIKENHEQWEVGEKGLLAWRPLPEPYKAESEVKE